MTEGKWKLSEDKVKRLVELQMEMDQLQRDSGEDDNGELRELPLKDVTQQVLDVDATPVPSDEFAQYKDRTSNVMADIADAFRSGRMLIAIVHYDGDQLRLTRHTHGFNPDDFGLVCDMLRKDLLGEATPQMVKPLPRVMVKRPKPENVLFGKAEEGKEGE